jgi:prevent-host-death family protein
MGVFMETISSKDIRDNLSNILNKVAYKGQKYTLTRSGKDMAVIISMEDWQRIEKLLHQMEEEEDIRDADEAHHRYIKEGGIPLDQAKKELGL